MSSTSSPSPGGISAVLFSPFFGRCRSAMLPLVLSSWGKNRVFDFILHTDCANDFRQAGVEAYPNIHLLECSFDDWIQDLFGALHIAPRASPQHFKHMTRFVTNAKPTFGEGFREIVSPYNFWGYIDIDVVLGNVEAYLTPSEMAEIDVFTFSPIMRGNLTLLRNQGRLNEAWRRIPDVTEKWFRWPPILIDEEPSCFPATLGTIEGLTIQNLTPETSWSVDFRWNFLRMNSCWSDQMSEIIYDGSRLFSGISGREYVALVLDALWKYSRDVLVELPELPISFFPLPPRASKRWIEEVQTIESADALCRTWSPPSAS